MVMYYFHGREVGFIQRLYIISTAVRSVLLDGLLLLYVISTAVRSGLPDGVLLLLLPRHLSMMRVVRWVSHGL